MKHLILLLSLTASVSFGQTVIIPPKESVPVATSATIAQYNGAKVVELAEAELGTFKQPGSDDDRVRLYCTSTYQDDSVYVGDGWCSAFVSFILKEAGYQFSPNNTDFGWNFVIQRIPIEKAKPGDIAMLDSHIAFYLGEKINKQGQDVIGLLGGNQDYQVCVMWVPKIDIEYCAEAFVSPNGWFPSKHIPNGMTATGAGSGINVLDDGKTNLRWAQPPVKHTVAGHPL